MCDCENCPVVKDIIPHHEKFTAPASRRAWQNTKYKFWAGYSHACEEIAKRMAKAKKAWQKRERL